jgi:hypothetical protein
MARNRFADSPGRAIVQIRQGTLKSRGGGPDVNRMRQPFPLLSVVGLLGLGPILAPVTKVTTAVTGTVTSTVTAVVPPVAGVVGNGAAGVVTAPGQGLLPDTAAAVAQPVVTAGQPVVGQAVAVVPQKAVRVQTPGGAWQDLPAGAAVPNGTLIDARNGAVTLTAAVDAAGTLQSAEFSGAIFMVEQATAANPVTNVILRGGDFAACPKASSKHVRSWSAFASRAKRPVRRLFGSGHGRFRTQGRFAAATVRGTIWLTEDYCDRTVITVRRGLVAVRDLRSGRTVEVPAGSSRTIRRR